MVISWISVVSRPHPEHRKVGLVRTSTMSTRERWLASIGSTRSPRFTAYPSHPTTRLVQSARGKVLPPPLGSVLSAPAQEYRWGTLPSTYPATPVLPDEPKFSSGERGHDAETCPVAMANAPGGHRYRRAGRGTAGDAFSP